MAENQVDLLYEKGKKHTESCYSHVRRITGIKDNDIDEKEEKEQDQ